MQMQIPIEVIVTIVFCLIALGIGIFKFIKMTKEQKIQNVKEWLKWAVSEAEKELGTGTGQLKLRKVYNLAVQQFPWIVSFVSFNTFSAWVDDALIWMDEQLSKNARISEYVGSL